MTAVFIISSLFPYFNLFVSIFIQSYVNIKLHVSTLYRYYSVLFGSVNIIFQLPVHIDIYDIIKVCTAIVLLSTSNDMSDMVVNLIDGRNRSTQTITDLLHVTDTFYSIKFY
jgi:hypothetical protein